MLPSSRGQGLGGLGLRSQAVEGGGTGAPEHVWTLRGSGHGLLWSRQALFMSKVKGGR